MFNSLRTDNSDIYYFAGKNNGECDFVVSPHGDPRCIQVCWELTAQNQDREIQGIIEAMNFFDSDKATIVTFDTEDLINTAGKTIQVVPAWKL